MSENSSHKKQVGVDDDDNKSFILPTEMLAPLHLWASSSDDDDAEVGENEKAKKICRKTYLAPFVATPSIDAKFLVESLTKNNLLSCGGNSASALSKSSCLTICDIGCGDGTFLYSLCEEIINSKQDSSSSSSSHIRAIGFDIDEQVIESALRKNNSVSSNNNKNNITAHFLVADICKFKSAEELLSYLSEKCNNDDEDVELNGIYIYLFPEAMKRIEGMISMMIDASKGKLEWIVTRRWNIDLTGEMATKLELVDVAKEEITTKKNQSSTVPFYIYKIR